MYKKAERSYTIGLPALLALNAAERRLIGNTMALDNKIVSHIINDKLRSESFSLSDGRPRWLTSSIYQAVTAIQPVIPRAKNRVGQQ